MVAGQKKGQMSRTFSFKFQQSLINLLKPKAISQQYNFIRLKIIDIFLKR